MSGGGGTTHPAVVKGVEKTAEILEESKKQTDAIVNLTQVLVALTIAMIFIGLVQVWFAFQMLQIVM